MSDSIELKQPPLTGLKLLKLHYHRDDRGFFVERYNEKTLRQAGLSPHFVQVNHSRSVPNTLRGLHYQINPNQGKLIGVIRGRIWDVAVDLRPQSPTFGKWFGLELSEDAGLLFWIPPGFAHGFCVLGTEPADVLYHVDAHHSAAGDRGILYDDKDLSISWPISNPLVSTRDKSLKSFQEYRIRPDFLGL